MRKGVFLLPEGDIGRSSHRVTLAICGLFLFLMIAGVTNLYSAAMGGVHFQGQFRHSFVAVVAFFVAGWVIPPRFYLTYCYWIFGTIIFLLALVPLVAPVTMGAQRWIPLGPVSIQPSEFAKLATIIVVAHYFHYNTLTGAYRLRDVWPVLGMVGLIFVLIFTQPDLGTAGICVLCATAQVSMLRLNLKSLALVGVGGVVMAILGWTVFLHDYQRTRVLTLLDPEHDPTGNGYNVLQSLVAVGSGGVFGKGFLAGTQTQLQFLPARHTDFIFSVFSEEHGFFAGAFLFLLFAVVTFLALEIARQAKDTFSSLVAVGIAALIFIQFTINIAMVLGMFPVVGIPLPMFSHGGSSLVTTAIALGILIAIHRSRISKERGFSGRDTGKVKL